MDNRPPPIRTHTQDCVGLIVLLSKTEDTLMICHLLSYCVASLTCQISSITFHLKSLSFIKDDYKEKKKEKEKKDYDINR